MRTIRLTVLAVAMAAFTNAQDVQYNFDRQTDFSRFKTYKWIQISGSQQLDSLLAKDIRDTLDAALAKKALTKVESDPADLYVGYQVAVNEEKQIVGHGGWGYGPGWRGRPGFGSASTSTILIGTLALDMYEVSKKQLAWRGTVTKAIDTNARPETRRKNMAKAFDKMLRNYPPGKK
ncbi:MAG: DUF4136 domain-containing protein [Acidobacteriales bacterium]|nr:DUF4136 domain-containing protein [Terriglobales bacterium]